MPDVRRLAAAYAVGQAKNHPFVDGCERTDYAAMAMDEAGLATWLREHCRVR